MAPSNPLDIPRTPICFIAFLALLCTLMGTPTLGEEEARLHGSWENDIYLTPTVGSSAGTKSEDGGLIDYDLSLALTYSEDSFEITSTSRFTDKYDAPDYAGNFYRQNFDANFRLGIFNLASEVVFYPYMDPDTARSPDQRLEYWLNEASFTFAGLTLSGTLLNQYVARKGYAEEGDKNYAFPDAYGWGTELSLYGDMPSGIRVEVSSRFGMEEDEREILGISEGSGYKIDMITQMGSRKLAMKSIKDLHYVETTAELDNISLGCLEIDSTTKFHRETGFKSLLLEFLLHSQKWPLLIDTELKFTNQTKTLTLDPEINLDFGCTTISLDLAKDDFDAYLLEFEGISFNRLPIGPAQISSVTALKGNLYKDYGAKDIKLRAHDYIVDPKKYPDEPAHYYETKYDEIISIEAGKPYEECCPGYDFGFDFYFQMGEANQLFDIAMVTGQTTVKFMEDLEVGAGVSFGAEDEEIECLLEFNTYF